MPILIKRADGGVSVMHLADDADAATEVARWEASRGKALSWEAVESVPPKDEFRNALGHDLKPDMEKAREIHRARIREARKPLLAALDVEVMRAVEWGGPTEQIARKKQALRDATADPRIEAAQTIDELKGVWPL